MNSGLTSPPSSRLFGIFGTPGPANNGGLADVTSGLLRRHVESDTIEGMRVELLSTMANALRAAFENVRAAGRDDLLVGLKTAGTLVLRGQHGTSGFVWSNHAFGIAIDFYYGSGPIPQGDLHTYQGILDLYPFFHQQKLYWGAGYHTASRRDSMHFELSLEKLEEIRPLIV